MSLSSSYTTAGPQRAITDVYDEQRRTFLVKYPVPLVVGLALSGVVAFALTGFLGFRAGPGFQQLQPWDTSPFLFKEPWVLFLWFCALIMTLEISILRDRRVRTLMVAALVVTVISMILVGIFYFFGLQIQDLLQKILNLRQVLPEIGQSPYTYTLINFGILAIFWLDTLRRWVRVAMGKPLRRGVDIGIEQEDRQAHDVDNPTLDELVSGDLIAGAALALVLALVFHASIINFLSTALNTNVKGITTCTVSWPVGHCGAGGTPADPPTLFFMDLLQTLIYLPLGLLILALSATIAGLGAAGGVEAPTGSMGRVQVTTQPVSREGESAATGVGTEVAQTLFDTLRSALNRRARFAAGNFALSVRNVVWPVLVFAGTFSAAAAAREIQLYLHILSDEKTCGEPNYLSCDWVRTHLTTNGQPYTQIAAALVLGAVAVLAITFAMALLVFRQRVAENTLRFLALIGLIVLLTFWIFSLTLSAFNGLLWLLSSNVRVPFPQPGVDTIVSLVAFLGWGVYLLATRGRRSGSAPSAATTPSSRASSATSDLTRT